MCVCVCVLGNSFSDDSDDEGNRDEDEESGEEASELQAEIADLGGEGSEGVIDVEGEEVVGGQEEGAESDEEPEDRGWVWSKCVLC